MSEQPIATIRRTTAETDVAVSLQFSPGPMIISTGIGFFDHMLTQLAFHAGWSLTVSAKGDLDVDDHHTVEDIAITLGMAFSKLVPSAQGLRALGMPMRRWMRPLLVLSSTSRAEVGASSQGPLNRLKLGSSRPAILRIFFRALLQMHSAHCTSISSEEKTIITRRRRSLSQLHWRCELRLCQRQHQAVQRERQTSLRSTRIYDRVL